MRRIKANVWGNWNGYEGTRKVISFGLDERDAQEWLETGETNGRARLDEPHHIKSRVISLRGNVPATTPYGGCP